VKALKSGNDLVVVLLAFKLESLGF
jgi:hypothetical protein